MTIFSSYRRGLDQLLNWLGKDHPKYSEALMLQSRLLENMEQAQRYGDTENRRADRAQIIDALNQLALKELDTDFVSLCGISDSVKINERSFRPHLGSLEHLEMLIDTLVPALFVGREEIVNEFKAVVTHTEPRDRVWLIHGQGGIGKSWLLFRLIRICRSLGIEAAYVDGRQTRTLHLILARWASQLILPQDQPSDFFKASRSYAESLVSVREKLIQQDRIMHTSITESLFEGGVGLQIGDVDLHDNTIFESKDEQLLQAFTCDLEQIEESSVVLILDSYEHLCGIEGQLLEVLRNTLHNAVLVVAGRRVPTEVLRDYRELVKYIHLSVLDKKDLCTAIDRHWRRHYGVTPLPSVLEYVACFSQGVPLVASMCVDILSSSGSLELREIRVDVLNDIVDVMLDSISQHLVPVIEVCAVLRFFNEAALGCVLPVSEGEAYDLVAWLRGLGFVSPHIRGFSLHDSVRKFILEKVRNHNPLRFLTLNERAAGFYRGQIEKIETLVGRYSPTWIEMFFERIYHLFHINEDQALEAAHQLFSRLRHLQEYVQGLLEIVDIFAPDWGTYFRGRLAVYNGNCAMAEQLLVQQLSDRKDEKLSAYIYDALGAAYYYQERYLEALEVNLQALSLSRRIARERIAANLDGVGWAYLEMGEVNKAIDAFKQGLLEAKKQPSAFWEVTHRYNLSTVLFRIGHYDEAIEQGEAALRLFGPDWEGHSLPSNIFIVLGAAYEKVGQYTEAEQCLLSAIESFESVGREDKIALSKANLGRLMEAQGRWAEAKTVYDEGATLAHSTGKHKYALANLIRLAEGLYEYQEFQRMDKVIEEVEKVSREIEDEVTIARVECLRAFRLIDKGRVEQAAFSFVRMLAHIAYSSYYFRKAISDRLVPKLTQLCEIGRQSDVAFLSDEIIRIWRSSSNREYIRKLHFPRVTKIEYETLDCLLQDQMNSILLAGTARNKEETDE
jgi:tetratricopeptide (TPR) repeat protein